MTAHITQRAHRLAGSLAELKVKVRAALATELAGAVGLAVRDVLIVALIDRVLVPSTRASSRSPTARAGGWREDEYEERDRWGEPKDPWSDPDDFDAPREYTRARYDQEERTAAEPPCAVPVAAAVAVGVNVGRWWLARRGTVGGAIGVLATALGLAGGPFARAALAVLTAATDVLTAESALARRDPS